MKIAAQIEILDIRHFNARQLRPLLEQEAALWHRRLSWDYRSSTELLLQYLDSQVLPGFVALDHSRVCGFTFCVHEAAKAIVGDVFAIDTPGSSASALQVTHTLLRHLLEVLVHSPTVTRIESQLLLHDLGTTSPPFLDAGFSLHPRLFMECDLTLGGLGLERLRPHAIRAAPVLDGTQPIAATEPASELPPGLILRRWSSVHYEAAAALIFESYAGHLDASINDQYRSMHGSIRFLHNIVRFPGCGVFDPDASWLLLDRQTGRLAGMILCSRVADRVAHITQLCIAPAYRGTGLGRTLLRHCILHLLHAGFQAITLTVTEQNQLAVRLYEQLGFFIRHRFDAVVLEKSTSFDLDA
ncbi:MAG TPA: GNAT family N-acetyltransferase [Granulicella sp.]|nr:GNAT family N-acetyltransferase [Granulicella sp.]